MKIETRAIHVGQKPDLETGSVIVPVYQTSTFEQDGFGGMISIELVGGYTAVENFIGKLKLFALAESLGGVESLVSCPAKMTHSIFTAEQRQKMGIKDNLVRLSVGLEHRADLTEDLEQALTNSLSFAR
jgi:cystathionine beta-lyase/cystathionine gamma-synthase